MLLKRPKGVTIFHAVSLKKAAICTSDAVRIVTLITSIV